MTRARTGATSESIVQPQSSWATDSAQAGFKHTVVHRRCQSFLSAIQRSHTAACAAPSVPQVFTCLPAGRDISYVGACLAQWGEAAATVP